MKKRMTIKEIDRFIEKLQSTETQGEATRYKLAAIAYLHLMCTSLEYKGKKSMPLMESEKE